MVVKHTLAVMHVLLFCSKPLVFRLIYYNVIMQKQINLHSIYISSMQKSEQCYRGVKSSKRTTHQELHSFFINALTHSQVF